MLGTHGEQPPAASSSLALLSDVAAAATTSLTRRAASFTADPRSKLHAAAACSFASRVECSTNRRSEPRPPASFRSPVRDGAFVFTPHVQQPRLRFDMDREMMIEQ
uniref:Uncharacterized protein n=1 Tax=Zea mays TaxID=4577 RepID=A0A804NST6_MAIZE